MFVSAYWQLKMRNKTLEITDEEDEVRIVEIVVDFSKVVSVKLKKMVKTALKRCFIMGLEFSMNIGL